jgi:glutaredoxin
MDKEGYTIDYRDVVQNAENLEEMLKLTQGVRKVPVLVQAGQVTIGYGGS